MIEFLEFVTVLWMTMWVAGIFRRIGHGERSCILVVSLVFYLLFVVPVVSNLILGMPTYLPEPGFQTATRDVQTRALYCLFLFITSWIWKHWGTKSNTTASELKPTAELKGVPKALFVAAVVSPIFLLLWAPDPFHYFNYGFVASDSLSPEETTFTGLMENATHVSVLFISAYIALSRRRLRSLMIMLPFLCASIYLNGKRTVVALALVMIIIIAFVKGELTGRRLITVLLTAVVLLGGFSFWYQSHVRRIGVSSVSSDLLYENVHIDYGRESRVEMAIYSELHPKDIPILDYHGQSLLFDLSIFIPRRLWPDKPTSYASYFTIAMLGGSVPAGFLGWGMTTTIFDEMISNCGLLGIVIGPGLICWMCCKGDASSSMTGKVLTILNGLLMAYTWYLFLAWVVVVFWLRPSNRRQSLGMCHS